MGSTEESKQRILVVDEEPPILFAMTEYFKSYGYQVDGARAVGEVLECLNQSSYAVAIIDLRLGRKGTEGFEAIEYFREWSPETRVIVLTAYGSSDVKRKARRLGVDAFLHKPKPMAEIAQIVISLMSGKS